MADDVVCYMASVASRERIQRDLIYHLANNIFQGKLNSQTHLDGMENGVYDLEKRKLRATLRMDST